MIEADDDYHDLEERVLRLEQRTLEETVISSNAQPLRTAFECDILRNQLRSYIIQLEHITTIEYPSMAEITTQVCFENPDLRLQIRLDSL